MDLSAYLTTRSVPHILVAAEEIPEFIEVEGKSRPTKNSSGKLIYSTRKGIENFWRWFGDSKTVDHQGRPTVLTHGTANVGIGEFSGYRGFAGHFALDPKLSNDFADSRYIDAVDNGTDIEYGDAATSYPVYLKCLSMFDIASSDDCEDAGLDRSLVGGDYRVIEDNLERIKKAGYDSVLDYEGHDDGKPTGIAVFDANQIKSATGNNGNFSPASNEITASEDYQDDTEYNEDHKSLTHLGLIFGQPSVSGKGIKVSYNGHTLTITPDKKEVTVRPAVPSKRGRKFVPAQVRYVPSYLIYNGIKTANIPVDEAEQWLRGLKATWDVA